MNFISSDRFWGRTVGVTSAAGLCFIASMCDGDSAVKSILIVVLMGIGMFLASFAIVQNSEKQPHNGH